jgi:hypothetical protein
MFDPAPGTGRYDYRGVSGVHLLRRRVLQPETRWFDLRVPVQSNQRCTRADEAEVRSQE